MAIRVFVFKKYAFKPKVRLIGEVKRFNLFYKDEVIELINKKSHNRGEFIILKMDDKGRIHHYLYYFTNGVKIGEGPEFALEGTELEAILNAIEEARKVIGVGDGVDSGKN